MKAITLCLTIICLTAAAVQTQTAPATIKSFLNKHHSGWKQAPGTCENRKWFLTGDFDGDGFKDYLVRVKTGRASKIRINLIAFFGSEDKTYPAIKVLDEEYKGDLLKSSFSVVKKGANIQLGEGDGKTITLENDAASQYICQTDAVRTLILKDGKWVNVFEE